MRSLSISLFVVLAVQVAIGGDLTALSTNTTVNSKTNTFVWKGKVVTDYSSSTKQTWRFITDGTNLLSSIWFSGGTTYTPLKVVEDKTWSDCTNAIFSELKLKLTDQQIEEILEQARHQPKEGK